MKTLKFEVTVRLADDVEPVTKDDVYNALIRANLDEGGTLEVNHVIPPAKMHVLFVWRSGHVHEEWAENFPQAYKQMEAVVSPDNLLTAIIVR